MSENGKRTKLLCQGTNVDMFIAVEEDHAGDEKLLRFSFAKRKEGRGALFLDKNGRGWAKTTLCEDKVRIFLSDLPGIKDWDETIKATWNGDKVVEIDSIVIEDDTHMNLLTKIARERKTVSTNEREIFIANSRPKEMDTK